MKSHAGQVAPQRPRICANSVVPEAREHLDALFPQLAVEVVSRETVDHLTRTGSNEPKLSTSKREWQGVRNRKAYVCRLAGEGQVVGFRPGVGTDVGNLTDDPLHGATRYPGDSKITRGGPKVARGLRSPRTWERSRMATTLATCCDGPPLGIIPLR